MAVSTTLRFLRELAEVCMYNAVLSLIEIRFTDSYNRCVMMSSCSLFLFIFSV